MLFASARARERVGGEVLRVRPLEGEAGGQDLPGRSVGTGGVHSCCACFVLRLWRSAETFGGDNKSCGAIFRAAGNGAFSETLYSICGTRRIAKRPLPASEHPCECARLRASHLLLEAKHELVRRRGLLPLRNLPLEALYLLRLPQRLLNKKQGS